ncbi:MAG: hypothetical protein OXF33_10825 [Rhodospirillales bacterium]|nr:hypothetical protein [Rhodospirillales bacterium]
MAKGKRKVRVFYSWQSDLPKKANLNAIRGGLKEACKRIEAAAPELKIVLDEATRDTSGSPNIASKILEKIEAADVLVADVTTITSADTKRPCPNPNVGYELGYAVAQLGWDRVVLLFNTEYGEFPDDLPFDFIQNRASPFKIGIPSSKSAGATLSKLLETALDAVVKKNPKRPAELRGLSREKIEHDRDVENLKWLMSALHLPTLDQFILDLPYSISDRSLWFLETFRGVAYNSLFSLYDPVLKNAVERLLTAWNKTVSHDDEYHSSPGGHIHIFTNPGDLPLPPDRRRVWDDIDAARWEMRRSLDDILERLRECYIEVPIHEMNTKAWKDYIDFHRKEDDFGKSASKVKKRRKAKQSTDPK